MPRLVLLMVLVVVWLAAAPPAFAADGVIEINQAAALEGGVTPTDLPGFSVIIDSPGSYRLTGDLSNSTGFATIGITADDVTLDLNGFTISGNDVGTNDGILAAGQENVWIKNGTVRDAGGDGIELGSYGKVTHVVVLSNGANGLNLGAGCVVDGVEARLNGAVGIAGGVYVTVRRSQAISNSGDGIELGADGLVLGNLARGNVGRGIETSDNSLLSENRVLRNLGVSSESALDCGDNCVVDRNLVANNGMWGLKCGAGCVLLHNTVNENGSIGVLSGGTSVVYGNNAQSNTTIDLSVTAGDGWGHNVMGVGAAVGASETDENVCNGALCFP